MPEICQRYARDMPKICLIYGQDIPKIRRRHGQDMPKICPRYAKYLPKISLQKFGQNGVAGVKWPGLKKVLLVHGDTLLRRSSLRVCINRDTTMDANELLHLHHH